MEEKVHYETAPEDRITLAHKLLYGCGAFVNNLLAAASGGMMIVLNLGLGMNPALVGLVSALPRLTDALTDPLMGYLSDNTRSRWGRRRPYIIGGALAAGLFFALLWQLPENVSHTYYFWHFLIGSIIFYLAYTVFATPWVALGYELTPDYHERTRLMGVQNFMGQLAYIVAPWFLLIMQAKAFSDMVDGAAWLAIIIGVVVAVFGILPGIYLRERFVMPAPKPCAGGQGAPGLSGERGENPGGQSGTSTFFSSLRQSMRNFFAGFLCALRVRPFLILCAATFLVFNGFMLISSFQFYVIIYYVFGGDTEAGAVYAGWSGTIGAISTFAVIAIVTYMATHVGKLRAFQWAIGISVVGYALKWFCYNPEHPWLLLLPAPLMAFGLGGLFTLMGSMMADVCDLDELDTRERREGMFGSIFWWVVKLGMALALAGGGILLNATGFKVELGPFQTPEAIFLMRLFDVVVPVGTSLLAMWAMTRFPLTEQRAHEIRDELENRRGDIPVPAPAQVS